MPIRKILVPLSGRLDPDVPESLDWPALKTGLKVGQQLAAHVEVLCVTGPPQDPKLAVAAWIPDYGVAQLIDMIEKEGGARRKRARSSFEAAINELEKRPAITSDACLGFSVDFVERAGDIRESVAARGRLSDLVVIANSPERWQRHYRPILDAALRDTGRPLLVLPPKAPVSVGRRVVLAWNGSIEAARAISALLDFVRPGAQVAIVTVQKDQPIEPGIEEVASYLRWHGIKSEFFVLQGDSQPSSDTIIRYAGKNDCDLLVMGAVIHSHAHRMVFGGMTETVLSGSQIPALMVT